MSSYSVSLQDILIAREERAMRQRELLERYKLPLVSFTMNIAGAVKRSSLSDLAFRRGCIELEETLGKPKFKLITDRPAGIEALYVYDLEADYIKSVCIAIEDEKPVGRLYDMDVLQPDGEKLSRPAARKCIVCGGNAHICARSRIHGLEAVVKATDEVLAGFAADDIAASAVEALNEEVSLTPKPGLVDLCNNGAHHDMTPELFFKSSAALRPYFRESALLGISSDECMADLKKAGIHAEHLMFEATSGVNTHKGAVYILGLLCAALGAYLKRGGNVFERAAALAASAENTESDSHGESVRRRYRSCGPRNEALNGFPGVKEGLASLNFGEDELTALMRIMLVCNDSNLLYRGGEEGVVFARQTAGRILRAERKERASLASEADKAFIERNLSPGGCADLLSAAILMNKYGIISKTGEDPGAYETCMRGIPVDFDLDEYM